MNFNALQLIGIGVGFLSLLLLVAYVTDRGWLPSKLVRHPLTYILSLGVYASVWTFYGAIGLAHHYGYSFLASYLGASAAFILGPILLQPLLRLTRSYQLSSIADLFAFRFRSQSAGSAVTLLMLIASLPLISIQMQAVTETVALLNNELQPDHVALFFCLTMALFAILFGVRHPSIRHKHEGLVVAMALESVIKLGALAIIAGYALFGVFGGNQGLELWLVENSERISAQYQPVASDYWRTLLLAFFTSALVMPHMFHMLFTENVSPRGLSRAGWGFPLLLLLLAICIPPILWAGMKLNLSGPPEYFALALGAQAQSPLLSVIAFVGGLAAASGIIVVSIIALSGMIINHLMLPLLPGHQGLQLYQRLVWTRRTIIVLIALLSYLFFRLTGSIIELHQLGLIAFVAFMQFLPGYLATLFWPGGTRRGFLLGLLVGMGIWLVTMLLPLLPMGGATPALFELAEQQWHRAAIYSLAANVAVFIAVSYLFKPSEQELYTANSCALNTLYRPQTNLQEGVTVPALIERLAPRLGEEAAQREVQQAVLELGIDKASTTPSDIIRLQQKLETNLSALIGPVEALSVMATEQDTDSYQRRDIHLLESHLERYRSRLTGLAAELDDVRRYHRLTLERLPVGVCSLDVNGDIVLWNSEMSRSTGLDPEEVLGGKLNHLPAPWKELLSQFACDDNPHLLHQHLLINGAPRWFNLHKATLSERSSGGEGQVLLLEDQTENRLLADELIHSERLASIGRLAAGVAHEVGNPITGIACLAQNLKYDTDHTESLDAADQILQQTDRIDRIIKSLMNFAHAGNHQRSERQNVFSVSDCAQQAIDLVRLDSRRKAINYVNLCADQFSLFGDQQRLLQALLNLLNNAADASQPGQTVYIRCSGDSDTLKLMVEDEGTGIPPQLQSQLFEPFFTTKEPGQGTGLGLSLVYAIVEEHYGSVQIESPANTAENKGTRVILTLPQSSTTQQHGNP